MAGQASVARTAAPSTVATDLKRAKNAHETGRFGDAARDYRAVLDQDPAHPEALHLFGVLQFQRGDAAEAEALLRQALTVLPSQVRAQSDLGGVIGAQGRLEEALEHFAAALRLDPNDLMTLVRQANTLLELRRYDAALAAYDRALAVSPLVIDALCNRGGALRALRRHDEALDTYDRALMVDPNSCEAWFNRGLALRDLARHGEALQAFERAGELRPGVAVILAMRGHALLDLDRPGEALAALNEAIAADPSRLDALYGSAAALEALGRHDEALARCERVLAADPTHLPALAGRANALLRAGRHAEALAGYDAALAIEPDALDILCNRAAALRALGRRDEALAVCDAVHARDAKFVDAWAGRAGVLRELGRHDEALAAAERVVALRPGQATGWLELGRLRQELGRAVDALAAYDHALRVNPVQADAHLARAALLLADGDFTRGWADYEWRLNDPRRAREARVFTQPAWHGDTPLDGRTILLHAELDPDETLQLCRYAPLVAARGARVVLEVPPPLRELMESLAGVAQVVARGDVLPDFDCHCPLPSLPHALRTELATIPGETPYLHAEPARAQQWAARLGAPTRRRVGLAWRGNPGHHDAGAHTIALARLQPWFTRDIEWIALQMPDDKDDEAALAATPLRRVDDELISLADLAALLPALDLVIAMDSAVAHLAGALGRPVWVLLPRPAESRWLRERADSPWYPTARLFRQADAGRWDDVVDAVGRALDA
ncbi:tetratricopeptide repeat protein [Burkholderia perseverans]|uniref:tetratricopeptide repeat protein n=1 Tax=Burkholderia perseverans TaxID=2615214 RepID=UPI001FF02D7F|nr:tetratricopeptide repeat protein [Burkholderia perseverans]